jgi:hypothetical protein
MALEHVCSLLFDSSDHSVLVLKQKIVDVNIKKDDAELIAL